MKSEARKKLSQSLYARAKEFLQNELQRQKFSSDVLEEYLCDPAPPKTLNEVYKRLLASAQNANMKKGVISGSLGGSIDRLGEVLFNFDANKVSNYFTEPEQVLEAIEKKLKPNGKVRSTSRSIWPQYCRTILSAATFMAQFKSLKDFTKWADFFSTHPKAYTAAPLVLAHEIHGLGFALACDFLKGLGYTKLGKPDVHIRDIFLACGLCTKGDTDYAILKVLVQVAEDVGVTAYNADKVFWLIGSGRFYQHPKIRSLKNSKERFIGLTRSNLLSA